MSDLESLLCAPPAEQPTPWRPARGLEVLGPVTDTALTRAHFLWRRPDGQVVQVSELLHTVVGELHPGRTAGEVAESVSASYGRLLTDEGLQHLLETRLAPLGLVERDDRPQAERLPTAAPVLSLALRGTLLPPRWVQGSAAVLQHVFWTPVVAVALAGWVAVDVALVRRGDLAPALRQLLAAPAALLALYAVLVLAALVHEMGHAAACRYGGARPGRIGYGVYLVFPAFYTDVTDSYRLGRAGRLRTDLGGLYFNVLTLLLLGGGYLVSGQALLLFAVLVLHLEMLEQLVPVVRFDGYYVLADLVGVPDLFARVRPTLLSLLPRRPLHPRVAELRPWARRVVAGWVLVVMPLLAFGLGWLVWSLPTLVTQTYRQGSVQVEQAAVDWAAGAFLGVVLSAVSLLLLVLPLAGAAVLLYRLVDAVVRGALRLLVDPAGTTEGPMTVVDPDRRFTAAAFTDDEMLPEDREVASRGWQRLVYRASRGALKPSPGPEERRVAQRAAVLRTPVEGTRRVVVMSRKGGVGKTTITLALGSILATERGDRVVAVDANPDAGNLAHRVAPVNGYTITDVLRDLDGIDSYAQLKQYTSQAAVSRLEVLASDDDSRIGIALDRSDYHRLISLLDRFYNLILLDTGTGILDSANQGLLAEADELVLVLRAGLDGGRAAALTLDWLEAHHYEDLVRRAVVVINGVRPGVGAPVTPMREHFERRCRRVVSVPWDPALETGARTDVSRLGVVTTEALLEMTAAVAEGFRDRPEALR